MSILRSARSPAIAVRVALASSVRPFSAAALLRSAAKPLPKRNWAAPAPPTASTNAAQSGAAQPFKAREWSAPAPTPPAKSTNASQPGSGQPLKAREWGAPAPTPSAQSANDSQSGAGKSFKARDWGAAAPTPVKSRDWGSGGGSSGGTRDDRRLGGGVGSRNNNARNDRQNDRRNDRANGAARKDSHQRGSNPALQSGVSGNPRKRFRDGNANGGERGSQQQNRNNFNPQSAPAPRDWSSPRGTPNNAAKDNTQASGPDRSAAPPQDGAGSSGAVADAGSVSDYDGAGYDGGEDDSDWHSRRKPRRESRSLLHQPDGGYELPPTHHHSTKGGKVKLSREDRERSSRSWAFEDEDPAEIEAYEEAQRMEREKKERQAQKAALRARQLKDEMEKSVFIPSSITVSQLADKFGVKLIHLIRKMNQVGMPENHRRADYLLNSDEAGNLAIEFDLNPIIDEDKGFDIFPEPEGDLSECPLRPPVVTIMGHVDHGKTTLLDSLRHTSVAAGEAGGITQHIAAFSVPLSSLMKGSDVPKGATITFLDTPGHAAFTGMRARGAMVTDLIVLVVAADDGVMPQTKEVINLVHAAGDSVGLVVAINKCDKPMIDIERVKSNLGTEGILLEEDGGEIPSVRVSGLTGMGLDDLMETLSTLAEVRDLRARKQGKAEGYVLESHVDKGKGTITTVLVTRGTLKSGSIIVAGNTWAKVRQMTDSSGRSIRVATPGMPVTLTGWKDVPTAGDQMLEAPNEDRAKKCVANRLRDDERRAMAVDVQEVNARREEDRKLHDIEVEVKRQAKEDGSNVKEAVAAARRNAAAAAEVGRKELRIVIKGDVTGTVEAVVGSLKDIGNKEAGVKIVQTGVGNVCESDIDFAEATGAMVVGFNVECPRPMKSLAASGGVPVHCDSVIYRLIESVKTSVAALLPPKIEYRVTGEALVQQLFEIKISRKENKVIAGCKVANGVISKNEGVRVLRGTDREIVFEGKCNAIMTWGRTL